MTLSIVKFSVRKDQPPISGSVRRESHKKVPLANLDRGMISERAGFLHKFIFAFHANDIEDCRAEVI